MSEDSHANGSGSPEEEALRRFLKETFGDSLPAEALEGLDLSELAKQANLPQDPTMLRAAAAQMQNLFSGAGEGPVNWTIAQDVARQTAAGTARFPGAPEPDGTPGDPAPAPEQVAQLQEAAQVARLWLDPVISMDIPSTQLQVVSRGTWLHRTLPRWQSTVEPVAQYMAGAIGDAIGAQLRESPVTVPGDPAAMMERVGGTLFGVQFGHAIGSLARESVGTTDLGLPLGRPGEPTLVAANVADLIADHGLDPAAARIFLATRELAYTALFSAHPWLGKALFSAIEDYARGITLDLDALDEMVRDLDLSDPSAMQARRPEEMFVFTRRASQERALEELTTTLALIEGWVDHVTGQALAGKLPSLDAMREVLRRRRAGGAPAEQMLASTVGIELRPRRVREALSWWDSVLATEGEAERDAKWAHPDLLPGADVLSGTPRAPQEEPDAAADARSIAEGTGTAKPTEGPGSLADVSLPEDFDAELARLLAGEDAASAPREDEQGGIVRDGSTGDSETDGNDANDGDGRNDGDDPDAGGDPDAGPDPAGAR